MKTNKDFALEFKTRLTDELKATQEMLNVIDKYLVSLGESSKLPISIFNSNDLQLFTPILIQQKDLTIAGAIRQYFDERQNEKISVQQLENYVSGLINEKKLHSKTTPVRACYTVVRALEKNKFLLKSKRGGRVLYQKNEKYDEWFKVK